VQGAAVGRPDIMAGRRLLTLTEGMTGTIEGMVINAKNTLEDPPRQS